MLTLNDIYKGLKERENEVIQDLQEYEVPVLDKQEIDEFVAMADKVNADNAVRAKIAEIQKYLQTKEVKGEREFTQRILQMALDIMGWVDSEREGGRRFSYFVPGLISKLIHDLENYVWVLKQMEK